MATASTNHGPEGAPLYEVLFGRWSVGVAVVIVAGVFVGSSLGWRSGFGIDVCWLHRLTGLPCPGCGLTRAILSLAGGDLSGALRLHPFSLAVLPYATLTVTSLAWPRRLRLGVRASLEQRRETFGRLYGAVVGAFVGYGLLRTAAVALGVWTWR
jgi:hypothetical protein